MEKQRIENPKFHERLSRYENTVALKKTDRVIVAPFVGLLPINLYGEVTTQEVMEDRKKGEGSFVRYHEEFCPDLAYNFESLFPSKALDILGCDYIKWPGKHISDPNSSFQVLDKENMSQEEYLEFALDPTGFMMGKALPRHFLKLGGLSMIDLTAPVYIGALYDMIPFGLPPVKAALETLIKAGEYMLELAKYDGYYAHMMAEKGWPLAVDVAATVPFDIFNDTLRGLLNTTMDMLECPDELLSALEVATEIQVRKLKRQMSMRPLKTVVFFCHNGTDSFMSPKQFESFYWPGIVKCMDAVIEMGGIPKFYFEGNMESKLDILKSVPKGKVIYHFIDTDMKKVQEKLSGIACFSGGVDGVLLNHGTPEQVTENVRKTLEICALDGGYILDCSVSLDVAKRENLCAMFEAAAKYGAY